MKPGVLRRLALATTGFLVVAALVAFLALRDDGGGGGGGGGGERGPASGVGFGEVAFTVDNGAGQGSARCALLADTDEQRSRGLMGRTDLGPYEGMIFRFPQDTSASFYMLNTPLPLSIAWFDAGGAFVSDHDMVPCPDRGGCPNYGAAAPYRYALEVPLGRLPALGIGPGARLGVGGACP